MRFATVNLSLNLGVPGVLGAALPQGECNPGGSTGCLTGTKGCGAGGMTCVGTSTKMDLDCAAGSEVFNMGFDARIQVQETELKALRAEIQRVINTFAVKNK